MQKNKRNSSTFGTSEISKSKVKSGQKAERVTIDFFNRTGIKSIDVADNSKYPYDIYLEDIKTGLEVKNIINGSFYISENEMRQIEKNNTRLVFVDDLNILISKEFKTTNELKKMFKDLREINQFIIVNYDGQYSNDDLKIAITKENQEKLRNDFIRINDLTKQEILDIILKE